MNLSVPCVALATMLVVSAAPAGAQAIRFDHRLAPGASSDIENVAFRGGGGFRGGAIRRPGGVGRGGMRRGAYGRGGFHGGYRGGGYAYRGGGYGYRRGYGGAAVGAGVAGLAAGALIGGAIASQAQPAYGAYGGDASGYCASRYRSYDPGSGTFLGNDGRRHPCP